MNETLRTIMTRSSCRHYQNKPLDKEELITILKAGIYAPSASNTQLCEAFAITNPILIDQLADAIRDVFNERGENKPANYHCAYHAPTLVIVSGPLDHTRLIEDGSCILENMFLAASSLAIGSCWINQLRDTQDTAPVRAVLDSLGIPSHHHVVGCAALGYPQQPSIIKAKKEDRFHIIQE